MDKQAHDTKRDSRARRMAKATGAFLLLLASRLWAGLVRGWRELGRRDAADVAAARAQVQTDAASGAETTRRRRIAAWLPKRRAGTVALLLLLLLLLWRCGHDGVPSGRPATGTADAGRAPVCDGLLEHKAWTGRITYAHARDVTDPEGRFRVRYDYDVDVEARMVERTRRTNRGKDYLVQVFSPSPAGRIKAVQKLEDFNSQGLLESHEFTATGGVNEFEEGMSETGSMMSLTVNDDCSYRVFLQAQAMGKGKAYDRYRGFREYDGMLGIPSVRGEAVATSGSTISGTFELPALSERVLERNRSNPDWDSFHYVIERDRVAEVLGDDNLGTVKVTWHFEAID